MWRAVGVICPGEPEALVVSVDEEAFASGIVDEGSPDIRRPNVMSDPDLYVSKHPLRCTFHNEDVQEYPPTTEYILPRSGFPLSA